VVYYLVSCFPEIKTNKDKAMNSMQKFACGVLISNMNKNAMRPGLRRAWLALNGLGLVAGVGYAANSLSQNNVFDEKVLNPIDVVPGQFPSGY
jgi:hypothetical protein